MAVLVVLGIWILLALITAGLFVAIIRGGGGTDLPDLAPEAPEAPQEPVALPAQRVVAVETPTSQDASL